MNAFLGLIMAGALISPLQAASFSIDPSVPSHTASQSPLIQVEDGCGRGFHRNREGYCRPDERPVCPRGYHLGRDGRACWRD